jgi:hypothetical protein
LLGRAQHHFLFDFKPPAAREREALRA